MKGERKPCLTSRLALGPPMRELPFGGCREEGWPESKWCRNCRAWWAAEEGSDMTGVMGPIETAARAAIQEHGGTVEAMRALHATVPPPAFEGAPRATNDDERHTLRVIAAINALDEIRHIEAAARG
jgi:hypothetical protein